MAGNDAPAIAMADNNESDREEDGVDGGSDGEDEVRRQRRPRLLSLGAGGRTASCMHAGCALA